MKIKRLIIRNIASIEQGEIDFENGLTDRETGLPASLFLITGDTGSGKSVILDCISMALYGTTPRVKSVNGLRNNNYRNNDGEEIAVGDITQYTRIGISWKDECYSELFFTGNDGIDYISRFSLGRTNRRNYRKPEWTLRIGDCEIIENRKEEIKHRIQEAVGLSFEQFSRMAMLAQGQFATFLTGKKEERESILEQLTSTEIFSRYGEAISNIYKDRKNEFETSRKIYEEFGKRILDDSIREALHAEQMEKKEEAASKQKEMDYLRHRIICTESAIKAEKDISFLKEESSRLKKLEDTAEFRRQSTMLGLWDATTDQREMLADKIQTSERVIADRKTLRDKKSEFLILSADLAIKKDNAYEKSKHLDLLRLQIESQSQSKTLFANASAVSAELSRYISLGNEIGKKEKNAENSRSSIEDLMRNISSQEKTVTEKAARCTECQEKIIKQSAEREKLNQSSLRIESDRLLQRQFALNDLSQRLKAVSDESTDMEKTEKETKDIQERLHALRSESKKASEEYERIEKDKNAAENRYRTMLLSVEENFEALRRQLIEEHATNCPLCGQAIKEHTHAWKSKDYFSGMLSPLEEEKNRLTAAFTSAKKTAEEVKKQLNITSGSLKAKEDDLQKRKTALSKNEEQIEVIIKTLNLDPKNLRTLLTEELNRVKEGIKVVSEKLALTDKLQKEIDILIRNKESLDKDHKAEDRKLRKALEGLAQKKEALKAEELRIKELKTERELLRDKISETIKGYADDWTTDPAQAAIRLTEDAGEYADLTSKYAKEEPEHRTYLRTLDSVSSITDALAGMLDEIEPSEPSGVTSGNRLPKCDDIQEVWHDFHVEVSGIYGRITENETRIKNLDVKLEDYYKSSGTTEATLKHLLGAAAEVNIMRSMQEKHRDELRRNETLLAEAVKNREENLKALDIKDESGLEDPARLRTEFESLSRQNSEITLRIGAIKEKLDADEKIRLDSENQRRDLEMKRTRIEKWEKMYKYFGGTRFRTLVQSHILRPLLNNANIYLRQITDHYTLTCSDENEQLSILVQDRYHNNEPRSVTVLSGGERFMISLALSLALSAMNRPDMNVDILFIDEGFGTLDAKSLEMVMSTLRRLPEINGQTGRRVGVISHREELTEQIPTQIQLKHCGEGRSRIVVS